MADTGVGLSAIAGGARSINLRQLGDGAGGRKGRCRLSVFIRRRLRPNLENDPSVVVGKERASWYRGHYSGLEEMRRSGRGNGCCTTFSLLDFPVDLYC